MSLIISPELETQLAVVAAQRGLPPEDALAQLLSEAAADFDEAVQIWEMDRSSGPGVIAPNLLASLCIPPVSVL